MLGCSSKKLTICEGWGEIDCPTNFTEVEASDLYRPAGLISDKITSCVHYGDNNTSTEHDGFVCKDFFK